MNDQKPVSILIVSVNSEKALSKFKQYSLQDVFKEKTKLLASFGKNEIQMWDTTVSEACNGYCYKLLGSSFSNSYAFLIYFRYFKSPKDIRGNMVCIKYDLIFKHKFNTFKLDLGRYGLAFIKGANLEEKEIDKSPVVLPLQGITSDSLKEEIMQVAQKISNQVKAIAKDAAVQVIQVGSDKIQEKIDIAQEKLEDKEEELLARISSRDYGSTDTENASTAVGDADIKSPSISTENSGHET